MVQPFPPELWLARPRMALVLAWSNRSNRDNLFGNFIYTGACVRMCYIPARMHILIHIWLGRLDQRALVLAWSNVGQPRVNLVRLDRLVNPKAAGPEPNPPRPPAQSMKNGPDARLSLPILPFDGDIETIFENFREGCLLWAERGEPWGYPLFPCVYLKNKLSLILGHFQGDNMPRFSIFESLEGFSPNLIAVSLDGFDVGYPDLYGEKSSVPRRVFQKFLRVCRSREHTLSGKIFRCAAIRDTELVFLGGEDFFNMLDVRSAQTRQLG